MAERTEATIASIEASLVRISPDEHFMLVERRRLEREMGWLVSSPGMLIGSTPTRWDEIVSSDQSYMTENTLKGSARKLSARTIIGSCVISLPIDMKKDSIKDFLKHQFDPSGPGRKMGFVSLNEPGFPIVRPIKTELSSYIDTTKRGQELAVEGVSKYLNTDAGLGDDYDFEQIREDIRLTYAAIDKYNNTGYEELKRAIPKSPIN